MWSRGCQRPRRRPEPTLARLGGDEFAVLLDGIREPLDAVRVAERVQQMAMLPLPLDGQEVFTSASIGVAVASDAHKSGEDVIRDADLAMYRAKNAGGGGYSVFDAALHDAAVRRLRLETDLRRAVERPGPRPADRLAGRPPRDGCRAVEALIAHKQQAASVQTFPDGQPLDSDRLVGVDCDIWIPAARPDVLTAENVSQIKAKIVLQGANIPATEAAEQWMQAHGILSIPDFIANAGGVICAAVEYHDGTQTQAFATIAEKIRANTAEMLVQMKQQQILPREAAMQTARRRVEEAMAYHRL